MRIAESHLTKTNIYVYSVKRQIYTYMRRAHDIKKMRNRLCASNKDQHIQINIYVYAYSVIASNKQIYTYMCILM